MRRRRHGKIVDVYQNRNSMRKRKMVDEVKKETVGIDIALEIGNADGDIIIRKKK